MFWKKRGGGEGHYPKMFLSESLLILILMYQLETVGSLWQAA